MSRTAKGLSEQTEFFERRKLQQLKTLLSDFVMIELKFHAKAVELMTVAYQQIQDINDKADLEVSYLRCKSINWKCFRLFSRKYHSKCTYQ